MRISDNTWQNTCGRKVCRLPVEERFAGRRVSIVEIDSSSCEEVIFTIGENLVPSQS